MNEKKPLVIRDEIHGDMVYDSVLREAIYHPAFQRLKNIKQLGLAESIFPCANHTRFQHSLGASYLAAQTFDTLCVSWTSFPFLAETVTSKTKLFGPRTQKCFEAVSRDEKSRTFWRRVIGLAGLLHDVGHGPWSHTFEFLNLPQDFAKPIKELQGAVRTFLEDKQKEPRGLEHEELSILYIHRILKSLADKKVIEEFDPYFLTVVTLVNRHLNQSALQKTLDKEIEVSLNRFGIKGGIEFLRVMQPVISGPFDVDRMDYIQRDGRNCGVHIAGIEWQRIVAKVMPCLAEHKGLPGEPTDTVLVANIKNQHILDDFIFTLFQMYAQVYLHPKIMGIEETLKLALKSKTSDRKHAPITLETHSELSDEKFQRLLAESFGLKELETLLAGNLTSQFEVIRYPALAEEAKELLANGFSPIARDERPMMKDSIGLFLYSSYRTQAQTRYLVKSWTEVSPLAQQFFEIFYAPNVWMRRL